MTHRYLIVWLCLLSALAPSVNAQNAFFISNPYQDVIWEGSGRYGQYKAALHVHTTYSDGTLSRADMIEEHYRKGYDIVSINDHNWLTPSWDAEGYKNIGGRSSFQKRLGEAASLSWDRMLEMEAGADRGGRGMIGIANTGEATPYRYDHANTYWAEYDGRLWRYKSFEEFIALLDGNVGGGGVVVLNHPGRATGGSAGGEAGEVASNDPINVEKYVGIFYDNPSCAGMEIINRLDNVSRSDRILWDNILKKLMPDRPVWGFSNDDSHDALQAGYSYNIMLLPELSESAVKSSMRSGAFYAVSHVDRRAGVRENAPRFGNAKTARWLRERLPRITNIAADEFGATICVYGTDYDRVEWIADGAVICTGETVDLYAYVDKINSYVRAHLIKDNVGIAFTQPFGIINANK